MAASRSWEQTNKEIIYHVAVPADVRAKEVRFKCSSQQLSVTVRDVELLSGDFFLPVKPDDSTWELEDAEAAGQRLRIGLCKARPNQKWDCSFLDEVNDSITHKVFLDLSVASQPVGRVTIGLYGKCVPRTVENFRCLCTGERGAVARKKGPLPLHYRGCALHRIVPNFLCQGGDITRDPDGAGGRSIYGPTFPDEGFQIKHQGAGELLMANAGVQHNNHSQFAITMGRVKEFERSYVIFGRVVSGMEVLRLVELEGSADGFTSRPVIIDDCGELDAQGEPIVEVGNAGVEDSDDGPVLETQ